MVSRFAKHFIVTLVHIIGGALLLAQCAAQEFLKISKDDLHSLIQHQPAIEETVVYLDAGFNDR